jgi:hypothetical protein
MARKTMVALKAQADASIPDNATHQITAAAVRNMIKDFIDTMTPGFGALGVALHTMPALGVTPVMVPLPDLMAITADFTTFGPTSGQIRRNALGLPSTNTRVTFYAGIACATGNEIVFSLYRDGVSVPGGTTVSGQGATNIAECSFEVINAVPVAGDPVYEVRASKISGGIDDVELSNVRFILEVVPTIGV